MSTQERKETIRINNIRQENERLLSKILSQFEEVNPILPTPKSAQYIKVSQDLVHKSDPIAAYRDELRHNLSAYINDETLVIDVVDNKLSDEEVKEFVLHWEIYRTQIEKLAGKQIPLTKFVDTLQDMVATNINKKRQPSKGKTDGSSSGSSGSSGSSSSSPSDSTIKPAEDVNEAIHYFFPQGTGTKAVFDENLENIGIFKNIMKKYVFEARGEISITDIKGILSKPQDLSVDEKTRLLTYYNLMHGLKPRVHYIDKIIANLKANDKHTTERYNTFVNVYNAQNTRSQTLNEFINDSKANEYLVIQGTKNYFQQFLDINNYAVLKTANKTDSLNNKFNQTSTMDLCLILFYVNTKYKTNVGGKLKGDIKLKSHQQVVNKYYVDKQKLSEGILEIRYIKNKHLAHIKPTQMSPKMKKIMLQMITISDVDVKDYNLLTPHEKQLVKKIIKLFDLDIQLDSDDEEFSNQYEILKGEYYAGNNSVELRHKLKEYIMYAIKTGKITRSFGMQQLEELNIR